MNNIKCCYDLHRLLQNYFYSFCLKPVTWYLLLMSLNFNRATVYRCSLCTFPMSSLILDTCESTVLYFLGERICLFLLCKPFHSFRHSRCPPVSLSWLCYTLSKNKTAYSIPDIKALYIPCFTLYFLLFFLIIPSIILAIIEKSTFVLIEWSTGLPSYSVLKARARGQYWVCKVWVWFLSFAHGKCKFDQQWI